jgi:hypothetical protein
VRLDDVWDDPRPCSRCGGMEAVSGGYCQPCKNWHWRYRRQLAKLVVAGKLPFSAVPGYGRRPLSQMFYKVRPKPRTRAFALSQQGKRGQRAMQANLEIPVSEHFSRLARRRWEPWRSIEEDTDEGTRCRH